MQEMPVFYPRLRRSFWLIIPLIFVGFTASAQQDTPDRQELIFTVVEHSPEFPGGSQALAKYLDKNVHYPDSAAKFNVSGKVYVSFVVERSGQLTQIELLKGLGFGCDEEAIRVIKAMPNWIPGTQSGRAMRVKYTIAIRFGPR